TRAGAGVWLVSSRGAAGRHTREGHVEDVWSGACVEYVVHFARPLDERIACAVRGAPALAANRSVNGGRALLFDYDLAPGVGVPAGRAARVDRDLRHDDVCSDLNRECPV